jgi:hypothetical protein
MVRSYENLSELLKTKYKAAIDIYDDMLRAVPNKRPTCKEIIEKKDLWALKEEEFEIDMELRGEIIPKLNDENLIFSVLKSKLNI